MAKKVTKKVTKKPARPSAKKVSAKKPKLLAGENPQIAKGDGDGPVQAYIAAVPGWKQEVCRQLDALITKATPKANKAVKWNSPFYGMEGDGWFLSYHCFKRYVKVTFFKGGKLKPLPPGVSTHEIVRVLDIHEEHKINEKQFSSWVKQASKLPGWKP